MVSGSISHQTDKKMQVFTGGVPLGGSSKESLGDPSGDPLGEDHSETTSHSRNGLIFDPLEALGSPWKEAWTVLAGCWRLLRGQGMESSDGFW